MDVKGAAHDAGHGEGDGELAEGMNGSGLHPRFGHSLVSTLKNDTVVARHR